MLFPPAGALALVGGATTGGAVALTVTQAPATATGVRASRAG
jgi:hypothetical protein